MNKTAWAMFLCTMAIIAAACIYHIATVRKADTPVYIEDGQAWFEVVDRESSGVVVYRHRITGVCYLSTGEDIEIMLDGEGNPYVLQDIMRE